MLRKFKPGYIAGLAAAMILVSVQACNEPLPTLPIAPPPAPQVVVDSAHHQVDANLSLGGLLGGVVSTVTTTVTSTVCLVDGIVADIGIDGGTISLCGNSLVIPAHSLKNLTHIQLVPVAGHPGVVQFYPEGLQFATNAKPTLTLSTDGMPSGATAFIVYTDDTGNVKEVETTTGRTAHSVSAQIGHFSRYAVSW
jgi:hypothetical protein